MFRFDQDGLYPEGTVNESRTDGLNNSAEVTITYVGQGTFRPRFLWIPFGDASAESSLAVTGDPKIWTFTPAGYPVMGTYRVEGIENEGLPSERRIVRTFGIRGPGGILVPAFGEHANPLANLENASAALIEQSENNATDYWSLAALNDRPWAGWLRTLHEAFYRLDSLYQDALVPNDYIVDAVMDNVTSYLGDGHYAIPTSDNIDGVTPAEGNSYLLRTSHSGDGGVFVQFATYIQRVSRYAEIKRVRVARGRNYYGKMLHYIESPSGSAGENELPWRCEDGMKYGKTVSLAPSPTVGGWSLQQVIFLPVATTNLTRIRIDCSHFEVGSTGHGRH